MKPELKPEPVRKPGQRWTRAFLDMLPIEKRLEGLSLQERLMGLNSQEILDFLTSQEILDQFDPKQIEEYLEQLKRKKE